MKFKKHLHNIAFIAIMFWVIGQFFSYSPKSNPVEKEELPNKIIAQWKSLKDRNLIHGSIIVKRGNQVIFMDGPSEKVYSVASISKSFVGARFHELAAKGLDLDSSVCIWMKNVCEGNLKSITLRMLLNHRSGFGRDVSFLNFLNRSFNSDWDISEIDKIEFKESDLGSTPGSKFTYSNFGYLMLSRVLEIIEDRKFGLIVNDLAERSGMVKTSLIKKGDVLPLSVIVPFTRWYQELEINSLLTTAAGAGGIRSSTKDLIRWLEYSNEKDVFSSFTSAKQKYSQGWVQSQKSSFQAFWHNGGTFGVYAFMGFVPAENLKVVFVVDNLSFLKQWSAETEKLEEYFY